MLAGTFFHTGLGLGLEDSGLGLALGLGCCWTCYKSGRKYMNRQYRSKLVKISILSITAVS